MDGRAIAWKCAIPLLLVGLSTCQWLGRRSVDDCPGPRRQVKDIVHRTAVDIRARSKMLEQADGLELWDTPWGKLWVAKDNFDTMCHVLGEQQAEIYGDAARGVHAGDIVLDCGAHFGGFVKTALGRGAATVVAIDINPEALAALRRTFKHEIEAGKVVVYGKGVSDQDGTLSLARTDRVWSNHVQEGGTEAVRLTTIDKIVAELGLPRVDFIKMDIEGAEHGALVGARTTLMKHRPRMAIAAYHKRDDRTRLPEAVFRAEPAYGGCLADATAGWGYATLFFALPERAPPRGP